MSGRWITGPEEVPALAEFVGRAIAAAGQSSYLHPGDVYHRTFAGNRRYPPERCLRVWEDTDGISAWVMLQPKHGRFDLQVRPDRRDAGWEAELLDWSRRATRELLAELGLEQDKISAEAFTDDPVRIEALESGGWVHAGDPFFITTRSTAEPIAAEVPDGYAVRSVTGVEEAEVVDKVHSASFGSVWEQGEYAKYMSNPGYAPERELVAVAPDGELAAFTVTWHDPISGTGIFEPVGTHPNHRRLGLGRAVMAAGLERMHSAGLHTATVMFEGSNPGAGSLYLDSGFEIAHEIVDYFKAPD